MVKRVFISCVAAVLFVCPAISEASTIASVSFTLGGGSTGIKTSLGIAIVECTAVDFLCISNGIGPNLFEATNFTAADAGTTVYATAATDPDFAAVVAMLTNGVNDRFIRQVLLYPGGVSAGTGGIPESGLFSGVVGGNGVDLGGFTIDRIGLRLDSLSLVSPGSDPNHNGNWTDRSGAYTLLFERDDPAASAPEPASLLLVGAGLASLARRRSRR